MIEFCMTVYHIHQWIINEMWIEIHNNFTLYPIKSKLNHLNKWICWLVCYSKKNIQIDSCRTDIELYSRPKYVELYFIKQINSKGSCAEQSTRSRGCIWYYHKMITQNIFNLQTIHWILHTNESYIKTSTYLLHTCICYIYERTEECTNYTITYNFGL